MKEKVNRESGERVGKKAGIALAKFVTAVIVAIIFGVPIAEIIVLLTGNDWLGNVTGITCSILFFSSFLDKKPK